jgi:hypothetical protein
MHRRARRVDTDEPLIFLSQRIYTWILTVKAMSLTIAIVHYCEGAGHATWMLAIADALEAAGVTVHIAGGGAGAHFVDLNGYDAYEPTTVDFIGDYQDRTTSDLVSGSVVDSTRRISELVDWLRDIDPDAVVTDDMFAATAAVRVRVPQYVIKHELPDDYENRIERFDARFHCSFQSATARTFFYPLFGSQAPQIPRKRYTFHL